MDLAPQWSVFGNTHEMQQPYSAAVVMPTIGRAEAVAAIKSVYAQQGLARIQLLIGVDRPGADIAQLLAALKGCPNHVTAHLFYPGYSTSVRHGGTYAARDGGALRATLTMLANTQYVAYLDDDNWWAPTHLCALRTAIEGRAWAFSLRYFVHARSRKTVCIDEWESLGPGKGAYAERFGGFVDPNCLMIDKLACWDCIALWNIPLIGDDKGMSADRNIYNFLQHHSVPGSSGEASVYYALDENDIMHPQRLEVMGARYELAAK